MKFINKIKHYLIKKTRKWNILRTVCALQRDPYCNKYELLQLIANNSNVFKIRGGFPSLITILYHRIYNRRRRPNFSRLITNIFAKKISSLLYSKVLGSYLKRNLNQKDVSLRKSYFLLTSHPDQFSSNLSKSFWQIGCFKPFSSSLLSLS